ncbi:hypothetical protein DFQ27_005804 [Actinomortierella ambigua]|uniref:Uncharacterized protein n=1 Tax=Actinomortierella ambigua TaxID=1343610 RepID=A0A9P6U222_9FUNG|nr:hypothetical protein DFQ27_005804 [Actinomortierella ambigua]
MDPRPTPTRTTARPVAPRTSTAANRPRTTDAGNRSDRATTTAFSETTTSSTPTTTAAANAESGLSTAAIAGIGAGVAVLLLVIAGCLVTSFRRKKAYKKRKEAVGGHDPSRDPVNPFDSYPLENKNKYDQRSQEDSHDNTISSPLALGSDFSPFENQRDKRAEEAAREAQSRVFGQIYQEQIQSICGSDVPLAPTRAARSSRMPRHAPPPRSNIVSPDAAGSISTAPAHSSPAAVAFGGGGGGEGSNHHDSLSSRAQHHSGGGFSTIPGSPITVASSSKPSSTIVSNPTSPLVSAHSSSTLPPPPATSSPSFSTYPSAPTFQQVKGRPPPPPLPLATPEGAEVIEDNGQHFVLHSPSHVFDLSSDRRALVDDETDDEDTKHNSSAAPSEFSYPRPLDSDAPSTSSPRDYQKHRPPPLQEQQQQQQQHQQQQQQQQHQFQRQSPSQPSSPLPSSPSSSHYYPVYSSGGSPYQPFPHPNARAPFPPPPSPRHHHFSSSTRSSEPEGYAADRAYADAGFPTTTTARVQPAQEGPRSPTSPTLPVHSGQGGRPMMSPPSRHASPGMPPQSHTSPRSQPLAYSPPQYDGMYGNNGNYRDDNGPGYGQQGGGPGSAALARSAPLPQAYQHSPHSSPYPNSPPMSPTQRRPGGGGQGGPSPGPSPHMYPSAGPGFNNSPPGYSNSPGGHNNNGPAGYSNSSSGYQPQTNYQPSAPPTRGPPMGY